MADEEYGVEQHDSEDVPAVVVNDDGDVEGGSLESEETVEIEEAHPEEEEVTTPVVEEQTEEIRNRFEPEKDEDEGRRKIEESHNARMAKQAQEIAEYESIRKVEREKDEAHINELREKQIARKAKVLEEEKRLKELAAQEEQRRKHEDEERKRKKLEAERAKQEEKERKRKEAEERLKPKKPNYVITKRADGEKNPNIIAGPIAFGKDDMQKSKEQLDEEKRAVLAQRIQPLSLSGCDKKMLIAKAKELYDQLRKLESDNYDIEQNLKRQQYDMMELQERARQLTKGGKKNAVVNDSFDRLADKFTGAPPRIQLCSQYERHTDHRTYTERREIFRKEELEELQELTQPKAETESNPAAEVEAA